MSAVAFQMPDAASVATNVAIGIAPIAAYIAGTGGDFKLIAVAAASEMAAEVLESKFSLSPTLSYAGLFAGYLLMTGHQDAVKLAAIAAIGRYALIETGFIRKLL